MKYCFAFLILAGFAAAQTPCFTITVESTLSSDSGKHTEVHFIQSTYRAAGREGCNVAALTAGQTRRFYLSDLHATSNGHDGKESARTHLDGVGPSNQDSYVTIKRKASGAILEFSANSPTPSSEECQQCIHMCAAQNFEPFPSVIELAEQDLSHFSTLAKTVILNMPLGENGCIGTAKATLSAKIGAARK